MHDALDLYHSNAYLAHYGVKGMKWGIRKYRTENGTWKKKARIGSAERVRQKQKYFKSKISEHDDNVLMRNTVNDWRRGRVSSLEAKARHRENRNNETLANRIIKNGILPSGLGGFGYTDIARGRYTRYRDAGRSKTEAALQGAGAMGMTLASKSLIAGAAALAGVNITNRIMDNFDIFN